jgi:hypothetical protein
MGDAENQVIESMAVNKTLSGSRRARKTDGKMKVLPGNLVKTGEIQNRLGSNPF